MECMKDHKDCSIILLTSEITRALYVYLWSTSEIMSKLIRKMWLICWKAGLNNHLKECWKAQ